MLQHLGASSLAPQASSHPGEIAAQHAAQRLLVADIHINDITTELRPSGEKLARVAQPPPSLDDDAKTAPPHCKRLSYAFNGAAT